MGLGAYLTLAAALFAIGLFGVITRRNTIGILLGIELMLNAVNINLVAFARFNADVVGMIFTLFTICITVAEVALGLAITILIFRIRRTVIADHLDLLKGLARAHERSRPPRPDRAAPPRRLLSRARHRGAASPPRARGRLSVDRPLGRVAGDRRGGLAGERRGRVRGAAVQLDPGRRGAARGGGRARRRRLDADAHPGRPRLLPRPGLLAGLSLR